MKFHHVCIEALGHVVPERVVRSDELEQQLRPLYGRLGRSVGRLEFMTGVRERRFWPNGTPPSEPASVAGMRAIAAAGIEPEVIGCVVNASVCRDFLEPSTAVIVHRKLGLSPQALAFDVSNACLGFLNGLAIVANMIELDQIRCGLVVSAECAEAFIENTIATLVGDNEPSSRRLKAAFPSLTIGSGAVAAVVVHGAISRNGHRLLGGSFATASQHWDLCRGGPHSGIVDENAWSMETDAEKLKIEGCKLAAKAWDHGREQLGWSNGDVDRVFCHQVGEAHRRLLLETLDLPIDKDFETFSFLGNTGSASLPLGLALGVKDGFLVPGQRAALLGIGSGINCLCLGLDW